jgi:hypothetical protein
LRVLQEPLFAAAQLVTFCIGQRQRSVFLRKAVPKVGDELKAFRAAKFQERGEFGVHGVNMLLKGDGFNRFCRVRRKWQRLK